jgi:hypothetical protein
MKGGKPTEPPLGLDMDFGDALARFIRTDPAEIEAITDRQKKSRPKAAQDVDEKAPKDPA